MSASSAELSSISRNRSAVGHAISDADRNVADDTGLRRIHAVVLELDPPLANLRLERVEASLGCAQRVLRLVELLAADGAGLDERLESLDLLAPVLDVGFGAGLACLGSCEPRPVACPR